MKLSKYLIALTTVISTVVSAQNAKDDEELHSQGHALDQNELMTAYNSSSRIEVKGAWDVYLAGSYILWQAKQKGMDYCISYPANTTTQETYPVYMHFAYKSGFKVDVCTKFDHDSWMAVVEYTRLHLSDSNEEYARAGGYLYPLKNYYLGRDPGANNNCSYCKDNWYLAYDIITLEITRPMYVGTNLTFKPHFGAKGGWIEQKDRFTGYYTSLEPRQLAIYIAESNGKSDSWLLGPRVGVDTSWLFGYGLRFFGDIAGALTYQYFKTTFKQDDFQQIGNLFNNAKEKIGYVTPSIDLLIGFGYGVYFDDHKWYFDILAGYEFNYYFSQNMIRELSDKILRSADTKPGDLMLHGLTVTARFDF